MKLAALGILAGSLSVAHAGAAFEEYGAGVAARPAQQLVEAGCEIDVDLRGAVAVVELRQRIANPGAAALAASLEQVLPAGAEVIGLSWRDPASGPAQPALPVDAQSPSIRGSTPGVDGVDPALATRAAGGIYRVILQPIPGGHEVQVTTRYVAPAEPRASALRLVLPGRAAPTQLAPCKGAVRATPGPGAALRKLRVGAVETPAGRPAPLVLEDKDVAIHVDLDVAGSRPVVWTQTQPLADGWSASVVTVLGPAVRGATARRAVFVIDGSRSMDLVGRHNVVKVVNRIGAALPAGSEIEAIVYDRQASRVFGELRPATAPNLAALEAAIGKRGASNGSDLLGALALARPLLAAPRGQAMLILVTDGVTGELDGPALVRALDGKTSALDVHAVVLDPARTASPGGGALRGPVNLYGGAYVEVPVDALDDALVAIDEWMRPSWLELRLGEHRVPSEVRAGGGFVRTLLHRGPARFALTGHGEAPFTAPAAAAPAAPVAALALAGATAGDLSGVAEPTDADALAAEPTFARALAAHPSASPARSLAVLAAAGRIARSRREVVAGGGRYDRVIAFDDPPSALAGIVPAALPGASAIARDTLERLFRDQLQPRAYVCYQRALGRDAKLGGTVHFQLRMGRGEVTEVSIAGLGDAQLDACLLDAAYALTPPLPDFAINADDQTLANYPLTFQRRAEQAVIVLGDADSQSPLDIDGIEGGVPGRSRKPAVIDTSTPLGGMRPPKSP